jgi:hypothetical protein
MPSKTEDRITPLEPAVLEALVASAVALDRKVKEDTKRLNKLKGQLILEASLHPADQIATDGGGTSWTAKANNGELARVTFPADKLRDRIDPATPVGAKVLGLVGRTWQRFFRREIVFKPLDDFRDRVETAYPPKAAARLIKACETDSKPSVSFETATEQTADCQLSTVNSAQEAR